MMHKLRVIVVGGGAAGLMAAGQAALAGAEVRLLERMKQPGRKLGITGKGRCNVTNVAAPADFLSHFGKHGDFLRQPFARFFTAELVGFFEGLGLKLVTERGGRVFLAAGRAPDLVRTLRRWVDDAGVRVMCGRRVSSLLLESGRAVGVRCGDREYRADRVILATGGASYPRTGSTGDGYRLAQQAGHGLTPIRPALVPLETAAPAGGRMAGLGLRNVRVRVSIAGRVMAEAFGELSFTAYGVTGPVVLSLSGGIVDALQAGSSVALSLDLKPALSEQKLAARLERDLQTRGVEPLHAFLRGLLPRELVPVCLVAIGLPRTRSAARLTAKDRRRLCDWLKDFRLTVTGHRPMDEAIVTAGGVPTCEVDPRTMASKRSPGLFLAGELLDLHGDTGGYNLQAAFSTGWIAGQAAAAPESAGGLIIVAEAEAVPPV